MLPKSKIPEILFYFLSISDQKLSSTLQKQKADFEIVLSALIGFLFLQLHLEVDTINLYLEILISNSLIQGFEGKTSMVASDIIQTNKLVSSDSDFYIYRNFRNLYLTNVFLTS